MTPRVLFLSNGSGEDTIASLIASRLSGVEAHALPLVAAGAPYAGVVERVGPRRHLPSGGLILDSPVTNLLRDFRGGLLGLIRDQHRFLRGCRGQYALFVAVGDWFPLLHCGLARVRPVLFVGTAKSVLHHAYGPFERFLMRNCADRVLVRDAITASHLRSQAVSAGCLGNPMMDAVEDSGRELPMDEEFSWMAVFPGSRQDAYRELPRMLGVYRELCLRGERLRAVVVVADSLSLDRLALACPGWRLQGADPDRRRGLVGQLHPVRGAGWPVLLVRRSLGEVLNRSQLAFGQAGTANEQAAGKGLPVVAYGPAGERGMTWYRLRQKGLLGDALRVVEDHDPAIVAEIASLLRNPAERERRGRIGRERMGPAGGAGRIADWVERMAHGQRVESEAHQPGEAPALELG